MNQGIIVAILSFVFYLTNLLGGGQSQPIEPLNLPVEQQSYTVLGQMGKILADGVTIRRSPLNEGEPLGTVSSDDSVTILAKSGNWYKIRSGLGAEGWIPEYALTIQAIQPKNPETLVLGFYPMGVEAQNSLMEHGSTLTGLVPLGWTLDSYGGIHADFDPEAMGKSLYFAGNQEVETFAHLAVSKAPTQLLTSPSLQQKTISNLIQLIQDWGLKGVFIDLSFLPASGDDQLFAFLETLQVNLGEKGLKSMLAVPWQEGFPYKKAAATSDFLVLKAILDPLRVSARPLASAEELEAILKTLTAQIEPKKLIVALNTGGYVWPRAGLPTALSHVEILELAASKGASIRWDTASKSPFFNYDNGYEVWFENRYSMKYKFDLVKSYNLAGLALLTLGDEDPEIWGTIAKTF